MTEKKRPAESPAREHSVPWFWPFAAAIELEEEGLRLYRQNLDFLAEAGEMVSPREPEWATPNRVLLDLDTMRLREFGAREGTSVLVDAPYAGHSSAIADYAKGQSLVETLLAAGVERVLATDWKSATPAMRDFDIDKYLAEINVVVDEVGGALQLVGLCQGGWMSAMYAARFPDKVRSLVLAGAPIDTDAGAGPIRKIAHSLPMSFYEELVQAGGGRMLGRTMLAGWKSMHPEQQYVDKYLDLYEHIEDKSYVKRTERFERWYENPIDLPGRYGHSAAVQGEPPREARVRRARPHPRPQGDPCAALSARRRGGRHHHQGAGVQRGFARGNPRFADREKARAGRSYRPVHGIAHACRRMAGDRSLARNTGRPLIPTTEHSARDGR